jgi:deoxyribose-phosphate aldolase
MSTSSGGRPAYRVDDPRTLAPYIQHTRITADLTRADLEVHCQEAVEFGFNAAMVPASWVPVAVELLQGTGIRVASALDFPVVGVMTSTGKAAEAAAIADAGADELDIGVQVGYLLSGMEREFEADIAGVVQAAGIPVKVMLELPLMPPSLRDRAVDLAMDAGAAYLKNASSGSVEIAHPRSVRYLAERARPGVRVKASGGITSAAQAVDLLDAGAVLLGTSAGVAIVSGARRQSTGPSPY